MSEFEKPTGGRLHGVSLSPFVRKIRAILAIKDIEYELVPVMPGAVPPEFLALSPLSKVPVWEEAGWSVPDSSAIAAYLERAVPTPSVLPEDPRRMARDLFWEEYADTRLVETATPIFFQRVVRARVYGETPDEGIVQRHAEDLLPPVLEQLETLFVPEVDADRITIGALSVWAPLVNLEHAGLALDRERWPGLVAFAERLGAESSLAALIEEERSMLGGA